MDLRDEIQADIAEAFNEELSDTVHPFTCEKLIYSGDFDFETQTYPNVRDESYSGRGVLFGSYSKELVKPQDYQVEDARALVLQNEVTAVPQINDVWQTPKGEFKIISPVDADAADVTWIVQIRKI